MDRTTHDMIQALPNLEWKPAKKARKEYEQLRADQEATQAEITKLRLTASTLIRPAAGEPIDAAFANTNEKILALHQHLQNLDAREGALRSELLEALEGDREQLLVAQEERVQASYQLLQETIESLRDAFEDTREALYGRTWLRRYPEKTPRGYLNLVSLGNSRYGLELNSLQIFEALDKLASYQEPVREQIPVGAA